MFPGRDSGEYRRRTGAVVAPHLLGALLRHSTEVRATGASRLGIAGT